MKTNIVPPLKAGICKWNILPPVRIAFILLLPFCLVGAKQLKAQGVAINVTGAPAKSSAVLDLSTGNGGTYGFLAPKVKLQATNVAAPITAPVNGLLVYDTVSASSGVDTVSQGFYYWNGTQWCRLSDNSSSANNIPYGLNTHYVIDTVDNTTSSSTFAALSGMSITFTPVHSVVFVTFSAPGLDASFLPSYLSGQVEMLKKVGATTTIVGAASAIIGIETTNGDVYGSSGFYIHIPVTVTAGTSTTISISWRTTTGTNQLDNGVGTYPQYVHCTLFIND